MNRLSNETRAGVLTCLNEGVSIRSAVRITGAAKRRSTAGHTRGDPARIGLVDACSVRSFRGYTGPPIYRSRG